MEVLLMAVMGAANILCFMIGAKVGQKASKGEEIELPKFNPMEAIREHKSRQKAEQELSKVETILRNIDSYDGTSNGQRDVPKG